MKKTRINPISKKQAEREAQRKQVVEELKRELGDKCEVCEDNGFVTCEGWLPKVGHEIVFRSKGRKSCKMDRTNIIVLGNRHHNLAQARKLSPEYLQEIVNKRNSKLANKEV